MIRVLARPYFPEHAAQLIAAGIPPLLARLYAARGIKQASQLDGTLRNLLPFDTLLGIDRMAHLLADAIAARRRLLVIADYDADGATACAVALRGLRLFGADIDFIVPNRFAYGYGLTPEIVRLAARHPAGKPDLLLTVDNGIASIEGVAEANRLGIGVLITDHHLPGNTLPDALCIVNPNQPGCPFPSKHLAGVGVMFYVLLALRAELRARGAFTAVAEPHLASLLDLVALGTVADVVKLDDNNRILVQQGLQRIRAGRGNPGIRALLCVARKDPARAGSHELGFVVGPRLNAAGRLDDMSLGIRCLLSDDPTQALAWAAELDALNRERRSIEADMQQAALADLEGIEPTASATLTLCNPDWHQGVIGILASRLKDRFHRPTIVFAPGNEGELKGSGRSIPALHLRDALDLVAKRHPHLLRKFGGHAMAAGLTIPETEFENFRAAFESVVQECLSPADLARVIETDGELAAEEFSLATAQSLASQVWGQGFPEPLFEGVFEVQEQRVVREKHLKLRLHTPGGVLDAMYFFHHEMLPTRPRLIYSLGIDEYNGQASLQLQIRHCLANGD